MPAVTRETAAPDNVDVALHGTLANTESVNGEFSACVTSCNASVGTVASVPLSPRAQRSVMPCAPLPWKRYRPEPESVQCYA